MNTEDMIKEMKEKLGLNRGFFGVHISELGAETIGLGKISIRDMAFVVIKLENLTKILRKNLNSVDAQMSIESFEKVSDDDKLSS